MENAHGRGYCFLPAGKGCLPVYSDAWAVRMEEKVCRVCGAMLGAEMEPGKLGGAGAWEQESDSMLIERNEGTKMVAVWLDRAEQARGTEEASLQKKCAKWKKEGYLPVIYRSGEEDLFENTLALLKHNRRLSAQKEVEAEKQARKQAEAERLAGKQSAAEMSNSAQPAAEMRAGTQAAAEHRAPKPSILAKLGKKPPALQSRANQRTRKRSEMER